MHVTEDELFWCETSASFRERGASLLRRSIEPSPFFYWKGWADRPIGAVLLLLSLPVIAILVVLVRATSRGPSIYRQTRVGKDGRGFALLKIRTMVHGAEHLSGPVWTNGQDHRITRVGRILRRLHLDELPQLWNVVRGDMSLIGPRPERPEFVEVLARQVPHYLDRLAVPPGISGWAQVNLPPDSDLESVRQKVMLDRKYIKEANLLLDARLGVWTLLRLLGIDATGLLQLRCDVGSASGQAGSSVTTQAIVGPDALVDRSTNEPPADEDDGGQGHAESAGRICTKPR